MLVASITSMIRRWQDKVEQLRSKKIDEITIRFDEELEAADGDQYEAVLKEKEKQIHIIKTSIPQEAIPRKHSFWWNFLDFFWSLSDEESVIPVP